jgi:hypothetical protein
MSKLLTGLADRRSVHDRHVGSGVRHQDGVVERLVARLQIRKDEILLQIVIKLCDFVASSRHLQLNGKDGGWQQAVKTPSAALHLSERGTLVEARIAQQIVAGGIFRRRFSRLL